MNPELPYWRSLLFVPANQDRFIDGAVKRNADAYVLDLEDSVPLSEKAATRNGLGDAVSRLGSSGLEVLVRINRPWRLAIRDIEASVSDGVTALALPKVPDPGYVCAVSEILEELEAERGLDLGHVLPLGFVGSIAEYRDEEKFRSRIRQARRLGFVGSFCIHPLQVNVLNEEMMPTEGELTRARAIVAAYDEAKGQGRGSIEFEGKMLDEPIVRRATQLLTLAERLQRI